MKISAAFAVLGSGFILVACAPQETLHPSFGNAVHHNMSVHIINPEPNYQADEVIPDLDGPRAAEAQGRYDTGKVIQPERLETTNTDTN